MIESYSRYDLRQIIRSIYNTGKRIRDDYPGYSSEPVTVNWCAESKQLKVIVTFNSAPVTIDIIQENALDYIHTVTVKGCTATDEAAYTDTHVDFLKNVEVALSERLANLEQMEQAALLFPIHKYAHYHKFIDSVTSSMRPLWRLPPLDKKMNNTTWHVKRSETQVSISMSSDLAVVLDGDDNLMLVMHSCFPIPITIENYHEYQYNINYVIERYKQYVSSQWQYVKAR